MFSRNSREGVGKSQEQQVQVRKMYYSVGWRGKKQLVDVSPLQGKLDCCITTGRAIPLRDTCFTAALAHKPAHDQPI